LLRLELKEKAAAKVKQKKREEKRKKFNSYGTKIGCNYFLKNISIKIRFFCFN
jgi:hypothetical protein